MNKIIDRLWKILVYIMELFIRRLLHIRISEEKWNDFLQFVQFGIVGVSNTLISYIVYVILISFHAHYLVASVLGFIASVANAFYWNNKYVFAEKDGEHRSAWKAFLKTFISYAGTGLILANILLVFWVDFAGVHQMLAPILNLLITIPLNFILNKLWAFRSS